MTSLSMLLLLSSRQDACAINVFAAASLKEAFTNIARSYESGHPRVQIHLNFAGSQVLAAQINGGAAADVFASAAEKKLDQIKYAKETRRIFVQNHLTIVVRTGLPDIQTAQDLSKALKIVVADESVPAGHYSGIFFDLAAKKFGKAWFQTVRARIVSREQDVKAVLAKVKLGEADAGIVYNSDAVTAGNGVVQVPIPDDLNTLAEYPVAVPSTATNADGGRDFIRFLFAPTSQQELEKDGFLSPLRAPSTLEVVEAKKHRHAQLPLNNLPQLMVTAVDHDGATHTYSGASVSALIGKTKALTATFSAADSYQQTIQTSDLRSHKAVLVRSDDGNYQLIVPGYKPSYWVHWVRRIE
jgi:molybdate transport system substrate-binding protein